MTRDEYQQLAKDRLRDAKALLAARRWAGAYYLAGYAVECALKACIAKLTKTEDFPDKKLAHDFWTHNLTQLLGLARLKVALEAASRVDPNLLVKWRAAAPPPGTPLTPASQSGGVFAPATRPFFPALKAWMDQVPDPRDPEALLDPRRFLVGWGLLG